MINFQGTYLSCSVILSVKQRKHLSDKFLIIYEVGHGPVLYGTNDESVVRGDESCVWVFILCGFVFALD